MGHQPDGPPRYVPRDANAPRYGPGYVPREPVRVEPPTPPPPAPIYGPPLKPLSQLAIGWIAFALFFGFIGLVALYGSFLPPP